METFVVLDYALPASGEVGAALAKGEVIEAGLERLFHLVDRAATGTGALGRPPERAAVVYKLTELQTKRQFMEAITSNLMIEAGVLTHLELSLADGAIGAFLSPAREYWSWSGTYQEFRLSSR